MHFQLFLYLVNLLFARRTNRAFFEIPQKDGTNDGTIDGLFFTNSNSLPSGTGQCENSMM